MRVNHIVKALILAAVIGLVAAGSAKADDVYGRIRGEVTDPTGAVVPNAKVTVTNVGTGVSKTILTGPNGTYEVQQLQAPGTYNVVVEAAGFKKIMAAGILLHVTQVFVQNVVLEVGPVSQEVTVEAAPVQVEKTSMQLGATLTGSQIVDIPLLGRDWTTLQLTLPGVVSPADGRGNYATNGSQPDQNSYMINGVDSNDFPLNTKLFIVNPDAIAEVRMVTNTINPEYGRNSGAIMNAVTKAGSNAFHGSGFDFYRDTFLNSRNFFSPKSAVIHQNNFGGTIGGPIKKDKAFFFFAYQGIRNRVPQAGGASTVFTQDQRNGIFPGIATSSALSPFPMTGEDGIVHDAGTPYSTLFPTGHIPTSNFNPISASMMEKFVPLPNAGGTEYLFNALVTGVDDQYLTRIDYNLSSKDAIWGSWMWERRPTSDTLPFSGADLPGFPDTNKRHYNQLSLAWNHTFSPTALNELRIGYSRFNYAAASPVDVLDPKSVGFTGINVQDPTVSSWPVLSLTGYFTLGFSTNGPQPRIDQVRQLDDNFTKMQGRHTIKMGFNMRRFAVYNPFFHQASGSFTFGGTGSYSTGDAGADYLLGIPDTYAQQGGDVIDANSQEYYLYFQDQFQIRKNLTLTYGTGWQIDTPIATTYHNNHGMAAFRPGMQSTVYANAPVGYVFQGDAGVNAAGVTKYGHFGPRIGFAWSPGSSGKWSIRGGYGIYFNKELEEQTLQMNGQPPYGVSSQGIGSLGLSPSLAAPFTDVTGTTTIANQFPYNPNPAPNVDFSAFLPTYLFNVDPNLTVPYTQNFNLTVERQLSPNTLITAAYVGALGRKNIILRELNPGLNPSGCAADPACVADRIYQQFDYPQNFQYDTSTMIGIGNDQSTSTSNYNALQVVFNKHMSHGLNLYSAYTWSHAMDDGSGFENSGFGGGGFGGYGSTRATNPFNQRLYNYGPSAYDATHRFSFSYTYVFPTYHSNNWAARRLLEGWQMSGATIFQGGFPLDVVDSSYRSLTCSPFTWTACWDVPNMTASPQYVDPHNSKLTNTVTRAGLSARDHYWFNPNTFAHSAYGVQGNAGRNPLRGPGINNFDWSFFKDTQVTESTRIELRFEVYNLFNHTQFNPSGSTTDINSSSFGRILAARDPRLIQLAAKFYF
ncbi:MAG: carboxypeptidase-like regulatory domain-containing protein [Acidobacteriia bacterium]|nr:carboxypeptidase-like regulatory domain-containing protein [Terriglobia bacterium]